MSLSITLFVFWLVIGYAVVTLLRSQRNVLQNLLLAPIVGLTVALLPVFWLNRLGIPTDRFSAGLTVCLVIASALALWRIRPPWPLRAYVPFAVVFLVALVANGWPMLRYGFDWIAFANDDMANYTLWAFRFQHYGFTEVPSLQEMAAGQDYSLFYWMYELLTSRPGAMLLLAWTSSVTGLNPQQAYMPLALATQLVLMSSTGALVLQSRRYRTAAVATCGLLALSALTTLGTMYQLTPQIVGLALLAGTGTLLLRPPPRTLSARGLVRDGLLVGILAAGVPLVYTEAAPMLVLALGVYAVVMLIHRRYSLKSLPLWLGTATVVMLVSLNRYTFDAIVYLLLQMRFAAAPAVDIDSTLFRYYLLPSGLANFWGFQPIEGFAPDPWMSISIALGAVLLVISIVVAVVMTWRGQPVAAIALVMLLLLIQLFSKRADFGMFKLTMFIQPFLLGTLVIGLFSVVRRPLWRYTPLVLLAAGGLYSQYTYTQLSTSSTGVFVEVPHATDARVNSEFRELVAGRNVGELMVDTTNTVLAKFQVLYTRGMSLNFASRDFFIPKNDPAMSAPQDLAAEFLAIRSALESMVLNARFDWIDGGVRPDQENFSINTLGDMVPEPRTCDTLIADTAQQSIMNRWSLGDEPGNFVALSCQDVRNHLVFTHTPLGAHFHSPDDRFHSLFGMEPDIFVPGQSMAGLGRHLLFRIINPTPGARLVMDMTTSLKADGDNRLPPAAAIGTSRQEFPTLGRGAARVFSPPLTPQVHDGRNWIAVDMGVDGTRVPKDRTGLMGLYGTDVPIDKRLLVAFARDVSLVSADEYARLAAPTSISSFPADLLQRNLEFSGIYEDGWIADAAYLRLAEPASKAPLAVRGVIPRMDDPNFTTELRLSIDGREVARQTLQAGDFDVRAIPPLADSGVHRIDLSFSAVSRVGGDRRPVSARLRFIGFGPTDDVVTAGSDLGLGANWSPAERLGAEPYRWASNDAEVLVPRSSTENRVLSVDVEPRLRPGFDAQIIQLADDAGRIVAESEFSGRRRVNLSVPATPDGPAVWRLRTDDNAPPVPGEQRVLNFRLFHLSWATTGAGVSADSLRSFNTDDGIAPVADLAAIQRGELPVDGLVFGEGWYGAEGANEGRFRWADNNAELVVTAPSGNRQQVRLDVEPPSGATGPIRLELWDERGNPVATAQLAGRERLTVTLPVVRGETSVFRLHTDSGTLRMSGDTRPVSLRLYKVSWAGDAATYTPAVLGEIAANADVTPAGARADLLRGQLPADGLLVGYGWYPYETFSGQSFRWVDNNAELVVTAPTSAKRTLRLEVEPGPGLRGQPFTLQILDAEGQPVASEAVQGHQTLRVPLTLTPGRDTVLRLHLDNGGASTPNDPRTLNFRVFGVAWD